MMEMMDAKKRILEELMQHLDGKDGEELGNAMKPKGVGIEVDKIQKIGPDGKPMDDDSSDVSPGLHDAMSGDAPDGGSKMSDDEIDELIEALQQKLG